MTVFAVEAFAHIKKRLILAGVATGVEVIIAADLWRADDADVEELREPGIDLVARPGRTSSMERV